MNARGSLRSPYEEIDDIQQIILYVWLMIPLLILCIVPEYTNIPNRQGALVSGPLWLLPPGPDQVRNMSPPIPIRGTRTRNGLSIGEARTTGDGAPLRQLKVHRAPAKDRLRAFSLRDPC